MASKLMKKDPSSGGSHPSHLQQHSQQSQQQQQQLQQNQVVTAAATAAAGGDDNEVRFITPMYDDMTEPLDLSKLCLDDDLFDKDNEDGDGNNIALEEEQEEETFTRGRSRSRSVHAADDQGPDSLLVPPYIPSGLGGYDDGGVSGGGSLKLPIAPVLPNASSSSNNNTSDYCNNGNNNKSSEKTERTGPLQQKEIQALKKGLEEATHSFNRMQSQEDEEERVAADAEKRKRLMGRSISTNTAEDSSLRRAKILMLGDSGVGKSSLMLRWTLDTFKPSLTSTVGVNFKSRRVKANDEYIQVQVWDTAGQEQFHKITTSYYKGAQAIMLVYDITDQGTLDNVEYWVKNIKAHASDSVQVVLVGNKTDLRNLDQNRHYVQTEQGKDVALKFGIPFFETSAKESVNVDSAFSTLVEHTLHSWAGSSPPKGQQYFPGSSGGGRAHSSSSALLSSSSSGAIGDHHSSASSGSSRNRMGNNSNNYYNNSSSGSSNNSENGSGGTSSGGGSSSSNGKGGGLAKALSRKSIENGVNRILGSIRDNLSRDNSFGDKKASSFSSSPSSSAQPPPPPPPPSSSSSSSGSQSSDLLGSTAAPVNSNASSATNANNDKITGYSSACSGSGFSPASATTNDRAGSSPVAVGSSSSNNKEKRDKDKGCTPS